MQNEPPASTFRPVDSESQYLHDCQRVLDAVVQFICEKLTVLFSFFAAGDIDGGSWKPNCTAFAITEAVTAGKNPPHGFVRLQQSILRCEGLI